MTAYKELADRIDALLADATPGPWECKDSQDAPFDGEFRVLGPFFRTHIQGQTFDDRHWLCFLSNYHDAALICTLINAWPQIEQHIGQLEADLRAIKLVEQISQLSSDINQFATLEAEKEALQRENAELRKVLTECEKHLQNESWRTALHLARAALGAQTK